MLYELEGKQPQIGNRCYVAPNAVLIGDVEMHDGSSVWFGATIRADNDKIIIGQNSNVQDGSVLHSDPGIPLHIHNNVTIGHKVMLHGCTIGEGTLVGINAVILNGANIGKRCLIGANALVTEGMDVPDGSMVLGSPGKIVKQLDEETQQFLFDSAQHYVDNAERFNRTLKAVI